MALRREAWKTAFKHASAPEAEGKVEPLSHAGDLAELEHSEARCETRRFLIPATPPAVCDGHIKRPQGQQPALAHLAYLQMRESALAQISNSKKQHRPRFPLAYPRLPPTPTAPRWLLIIHQVTIHLGFSSTRKAQPDSGAMATALLGPFCGCNTRRGAEPT